jgi:hypothetical protein
MKFFQVMEAIADAAINAGWLFRCFAYAILAFCIVAPITVAAL